MIKGNLIVISAPSGTGKTTLCRELMKLMPGLFYSVSTTTREPRAGETDGLDYRFVSTERFRQMVKEDQFLEHAQVFGHWYGTPRTPIEEAVAAGKDVLLDVDVQGAMTIRKKTDAVFVFLLPPSMQVLEERLKGRKTDSAAQIKERIAMARQEIGYVPNYDYVLCNHDVHQSIHVVKAILEAERCRTVRNRETLAQLGFKI